MQLAQRAVEERDFALAKQLLQQHLPPMDVAKKTFIDLRRFEWYHLWKVCHEHWVDSFRTREAGKECANPCERNASRRDAAFASCRFRPLQQA